MSQYGLYPKFYVKRKKILFPLIEKYSGASLKGKPHGYIVRLYEELLRSNDAFIGELDGLIAKENFRNAGGWAEIIGEALNVTENIFGYASTAKAAKAAEEKAFYDVILNEQKKDDTMKILVVSGVTLAFLGLGVFVVLKFRKK